MKITEIKSDVFDCGMRFAVCATIENGAATRRHAVVLDPDDLLDVAGALRGLADWVEAVARGVENGPKRTE